MGFKVGDTVQVMCIVGGKFHVSDVGYVINLIGGNANVKTSVGVQEIPCIYLRRVG